MTRGTIVVFIDDGIYKTTQYNGDMYPEGRGGEAYRYLQEVEDLDDFEYLAQRINAHYRYEEGNEIYIAAKKGTEEYGVLKNLNSDRYYRDWNSDYLYIKNLENEPVCIISRGKGGKPIYINPGNIGVFHFGDYVEDVEEQLPQKKLKEKNNRKENKESKKDIYVYLEHNDTKPIKEAIVKTFANKVDAEEYLAERVKNAYGRYPDELKKDPLYEDDTIQSDAVIIQNDGGDVSSFVIRKN